MLSRKWKVFTLLKRKRQVLTDYKVDAGTTSPNDFAIMVKAGWNGMG